MNALRTEFPQITTILQNINPRDTSIVLQDETLLLYGKGMIEDQLGPIKIAFSPSAFYQINHDQCLVLYEMAKQSLGLTKQKLYLIPVRGWQHWPVYGGCLQTGRWG